MRARMNVDARVVDDGGPEKPAAVYVEGQQLEGAEAEYQVALGHAEVIEEESSSGEASEVSATPAAVEHAEATGVDLSQVEGSGVEGKVLKSDVEAAAQAEGEASQ